MYLDKVIKTEVRTLLPYTLALHDCPIKLNQNENPFDVPQEIKDEVLRHASVRAWSRYPDFVPEEFLELLAGHVGWRKDGVVAGNGSNEIIQAIMAITMEPGASLLVVQPTFTLYKLMGTVLGGSVEEVRLADDLSYDMEAILSSIAVHRHRVVVICSPNNPTGSALSLTEISRLCRATSEGLVVVDQAYVEFGAESAVSLLEHNENLVILRTFSKACSLAGLRVGYGLASPALIGEIDKAKLPYNLNFFSMAAAEAVVNNWPIFQEVVDLIKGQRDRVYEAMKNIGGVTVYPSSANFLVFETPITPDITFKKFVERGILIRNVSGYPMLQKMLRVSIGTPEENDAFLSTLTYIVREAAPEKAHTVAGDSR